MSQKTTEEEVVNLMEDDLKEMMAENTSTEASLLDIRLKELGMLELPTEEQVSILVDYFNKKFMAILSSNDIPVQIVVPNEFLEVAKQAFDAVTPESICSDEETRNAIEVLNQWDQFKNRVQVTGETLDRFNIPVEYIEYGLPVKDQFFVIQTFQNRKRQYLDSWDAQIGLSNYLARINSPIIPNQDQKELLFLMHHMFMAIESRKEEMAKQEALMRQLNQIDIQK